MPFPTSRITVRAIGVTALLVVASLLWLCLWYTDQALWQQAPRLPLGLCATRLLLIGTADVILVVAFAVCVVRQHHARWAKRCWAAAFATTLAVLFLEVVCMFVARSHNVGYTLASRVWCHRYWGKANSLGYRDVEHVRVPGKRLVFALGDSFTAGGGLSQVASRFSNLLGDQHGELQVLNLGQNGSDTADEWRRLEQHPLRPDVLVLQYYPNDIEGAAQRTGWHMPGFAPYEDIASVKLRMLVRSSYLANLVYWSLPHTDAVAYGRWLEAAYGDAAVMKRHRQDLERFTSYAQQAGIPLIVVVFPVLNDIDHSRTMLKPVVELLVEHGASIIDVAELVQDMDVSARTVNRHDAHASVCVHRLVAEALWRVLSAP